MRLLKPIKTPTYSRHTAVQPGHNVEDHRGV